MTDLADIIAKLEQATEGSRELDAEIAAATWDGAQVSKTRPWLVTQHGINRDPPRYTTSIDAARTLVPKSKAIALDIFADGTALCGLEDSPDLTNGTDVYPTPALALCIAALKARSTTCKRLRELAEKATQGPWETEYDNHGNGGFSEWYNVGPKTGRPRVAEVHSGEANAAYIAAANPATILALLDRLEQAERERALLLGTGR